MGNHDLDYSLSNFESLAPACNFPWVVSNAIDRETGEPLGGCHRTVVLDHHGWRVGVVGLIEYEWLETLSTVPVSQVAWTDYVTVGRELARKLREQDKVDLVVALTHMRVPNDLRLAKEVSGATRQERTRQTESRNKAAHESLAPGSGAMAGQAPEIDLVLGGHDHDRYMRTENRTLLLKSGTDFRDLSVITVAAEQPAVNPATPWAERPPVALSVEAITITRDCPPDDAAGRLVKVHLSHVEKRMGKVKQSSTKREEMGADT